MKRLILIFFVLFISISSFGQYFTKTFANRVSGDTVRIFEYLLYKGDTILFPTYMAARDLLIKHVLNPVEPQDAATKDYVDNAIYVSVEYFFVEDVSDIGGIYRDMYNLPSVDPEVTLSTVGLTASTDDQALYNFATITGEPGITSLSSGLFDVHFHAERTSGNSSVEIYAKIYKRILAGTETLITTTELSSLITSKESYTLHATTIIDTDLLTTDRVITKFFANVGSGSGATVAIYIEGTSASHFSMPSTSNILSEIFIRRDAKNEFTANFDAGPFEIRALTFESDITTGTAPFTIASITVVPNLNADMIDGVHYATIQPAYYETELTDAQNNIDVGFNLLATSVVFYNGTAIKNTRWSGEGSQILNLSLDTKLYDILMVRK